MHRLLVVDAQGGLTQQASQLLADLVRVKKCRCHPGVVAVLLGLDIAGSPNTGSSGRLLSADGSAGEAVTLQRVIPDASLAAVIVSMVTLILALISVRMCTYFCALSWAGWRLRLDVIVLNASKHIVETTQASLHNW